MWDLIREALYPNFGMGWNLFLALVPLAMALVLFRRFQQPTLVWWLGLIVFVLFLPNAAYVLTDVIHLIRTIRREPPLPEWTLALMVIPQYLLFMILGFQAHVISLLALGRYMKRRLLSQWVVPMELGVNLLCAVGIYWGRFLRFNSWDVVTHPERLAEAAIRTFTTRFPLSMILGTFIVVTCLYYLFKLIDLAILESWHRRRTSPQVFEADS